MAGKRDERNGVIEVSSQPGSTSGPETLHVLSVCTHNRTRSVIAGALLSRYLTRLRVPSTVATSGTYSAGQPAIDRAVRLLAAQGMDVELHRSSVLDDETVNGSDVIVTAERDHVVSIAGRWRGAFARTFTLPELVQRGEAVGPRRGAPIGEWLQLVGKGRPTAFDYIDAADIAEVADPTGQSPAAWDAAYREIDDLARRLAAVLA
jgi:protein-tyrosine-phosphatase